MRADPPLERLLVVEDDPVQRQLLALTLEAEGFEVAVAQDGRTMRQRLGEERPHLILLDVDLPDDSGFRLASSLRTESQVPIIFLTRYAEMKDRLLGLELGDDYVIKPPDMRELVARVRAVMRRSAPASEPMLPSSFDGWTLDRDCHALRTEGAQPLSLSQAEVAVLDALLRARGEVVARATLDQAIGQASTLAPSTRGKQATSRSLDVIIHRLRGKLGEGGSVATRVILTVRGRGYRIGVPVT